MWCSKTASPSVWTISKRPSVSLQWLPKPAPPVVTFYDSTGACLENGLALLNANSRLTAQIARISGVVPQVAVVTGTCAGSASVQAAAADLCIMSEEAELFLNAPFNSEDKVAKAGSTAFAARAGVAALTAKNAPEAAKLAARVVGLLPANNLAGPAVFDFAAPAKALNLSKYDPADAVAALADADSTVELYAGYGKAGLYGAGHCQWCSGWRGCHRQAGDQPPCYGKGGAVHPPV